MKNAKSRNDVKSIFVIISVFFTGAIVCAQVADPVADYKTEKSLDESSKVLRWECDVNGDGHNEVFLTLQESHAEDLSERSVPGWLLYIANSTGSGYVQCSGIQDEDEFGPALPQIAIDRCFVGTITEIGTRGLVTVQNDSPREGPPVTTIYTYTIEGDRLRRKELARYNPDDGNNAVFAKYLSDGKRTVIQPTEITP